MVGWELQSGGFLTFCSVGCFTEKTTVGEFVVQIFHMSWRLLICLSFRAEGPVRKVQTTERLLLTCISVPYQGFAGSSHPQRELK